jgi:putative transposase
VLHDILVAKVRIGKGKISIQSLTIVDSQNLIACNLYEWEIGYDGSKKTKERKKHIVVDTLSLLMIIVIHAANIHDSVGAREVLRFLKNKYLTGIQKIFAGFGYMDELKEWTLL